MPSRWHRAFAAVLALWLVGLIAEPVSLHLCPMHGGLAAMPGHVGHTGAGHHRAPATHGHGCTCLGDCAGAWTPVVPSAAVVSVARVVAVPHVAVRAANAAFRPSAPEHARPPSVGPPSLYLA
jgi:hypothetical protein